MRQHNARDRYDAKRIEAGVAFVIGAANDIRTLRLANPNINLGRAETRLAQLLLLLVRVRVL